jgi:hypothetical protein
MISWKGKWKNINDIGSILIVIKNTISSKEQSTVILHCWLDRIQPLGKNIKERKNRITTKMKAVWEDKRPLNRERFLCDPIHWTMRQTSKTKWYEIFQSRAEKLVKIGQNVHPTYILLIHCRVVYIHQFTNILAHWIQEWIFTFFWKTDNNKHMNTFIKSRQTTLLFLYHEQLSVRKNDSKVFLLFDGSNWSEFCYFLMNFILYIHVMLLKSTVNGTTHIQTISQEILSNLSL